MLSTGNVNAGRNNTLIALSAQQFLIVHFFEKLLRTVHHNAGETNGLAHGLNEFECCQEMLLSLSNDFKVRAIQVPRAPCPTVHSGNDGCLEEIRALEHGVIHGTNTGPVRLTLVTGKVPPLGASVNNAVAKNQAWVTPRAMGIGKSTITFTRPYHRSRKSSLRLKSLRQCLEWGPDSPGT